MRKSRRIGVEMVVQPIGGLVTDSRHVLTGVRGHGGRFLLSPELTRIT